MRMDFLENLKVNTSICTQLFDARITTVHFMENGS